MSIEARNISRHFGAFTALDDINLKIGTGELVSLLGPSGSGKTTLLRIIAGLERSDTGSVLFNGEDATLLPVRERQVGFVFQHYALFRHMSVFKNIAFGLNVRSERPSKAAIRDKVRSLLSLVQLEGLEERYPNQLSGGQRQRVALARALAIDPKVLLLDEPFGALDARVRQELRRWLRQIHQSLHITTLFVTHDQDEALEVADRVVVMNQARIEQIGSPEEIYDHPRTPFVHEFLGKSNTLSVKVDSGGASVGAIALPPPAAGGVHSLTAYVRPHQIGLSRVPNGTPVLPVKVTHIHAAGSSARVDLIRIDNGEELAAEISREDFEQLALTVGEEAFARFKKIQVYPGG
ncbi:MAG: sulfate transporter, ATPase subunit [Chthoniobacteraceae bacterium]|nr:sulfate transporter, ATPase subunit [Chthoniobacteraceae bacterium]